MGNEHGKRSITIQELRLIAATSTRVAEKFVLDMSNVNPEKLVTKGEYGKFLAKAFSASYLVFLIQSYYAIEKANPNIDITLSEVVDGF